MLPEGMVGRRAEWSRLEEFASSGEDGATLGVVWGRRRVGKSYLLGAFAEQRNGFYHEAIRGSSAEALRELGERLARWQGAAAPLALPDWEAAVSALLALGRDRDVVVVLDEYPYLTEHTPQLDSIIQRALGPHAASRRASRTRLLLCGSATTVMRDILGGTAPLRGRAGLDLRIALFDYRVARRLHRLTDLDTAIRTYAVIGGVAAYAREMVSGDLPTGRRDFDRWVCRRVLSPAAPLFREVELLLSEDPATAQARKLNLYHATLAGVATGHQTYGKLTSYVQISGPSLAPILETLIEAGFVDRVQDPIRDNRPTYQISDPLIRFHYAVLRRNRSRLSRHDADRAGIWRVLRPTFHAQVLGPCFEAMARDWTQHRASEATLGGSPDHVGPTTLILPDGVQREIDVVVAAADAPAPGARTVRALGEAKVGERITVRHLRRLEGARAALGPRAAGARLLLFGPRFSDAVRAAADQRPDVELIDPVRLYEGA